MRSCGDGADSVGVDGSGTSRVKTKGMKTGNFLLPVHRHYIKAACRLLVYHGGPVLFLTKLLGARLRGQKRSEVKGEGTDRRFSVSQSWSSPPGSPSH